jgi:NAD(P)-dependent dehydrogenase (short-subunit alcohol dehydrogenase family)
MSGWMAADIPPQNGKFAIVTGANSGIGYETALALARAGAEVVVASRSPAKGQAAVAAMKAQYAGAKVVFEALDLASLASVAAFAERIKASHQSLDILINNAGVMSLQTRQTTQDGFERQLGVNYLGHFALTAHLLGLLRAAGKPRAVQLSSIAHKRGQINLGDLQSEKAYKPWPAYEQSKLAMLMFALELQRRSDTRGWGILSVAAHPGFARTELIANGPAAGGQKGLIWRLADIFGPIAWQSSAAGALPTLFAATSPQVTPGGYYGPDGMGEMKGAPVAAKISAAAKDHVVARKLWEASEAATGIKFGP